MPTSQIYEVPLVLVDAQNKTLPTTPVQVIAGIPGKILRFWNADVFVDVRAGAYTNIDELMIVQFAYASGNSVSGGLVDSAGALADTGTVTALDVGSFLSISIPEPFNLAVGRSAGLADVVGQAINIKAINGSLGNFTGGHVDNRIHVRMFYTINDVPLT